MQPLVIMKSFSLVGNSVDVARIGLVVIAIVRNEHKSENNKAIKTEENNLDEEEISNHERSMKNVAEMALGKSRFAGAAVSIIR